jgi:TPR repeat protein
MKSRLIDHSSRERNHSKVAAVLIALVFLPCFSLTLFNPISQAADDQPSKAVRRTSSDQRRVALVIGNSDYKVGPLRNPAHDAEDVSDVLRTLGFAVQTKVNANQREMEKAVDKFVQEIQHGDVALFYFSGHGVQIKGENYLVPIGDAINSETDVRYKTVPIGSVLGKMEESGNRANIVILDACRNNPFKGLFRSPSMGLSKMDAPKGTFIAYATSPDSVAADGRERNSPYTKHLVEALQVKDIPIEQAFKLVARAVNKETGGQQTPWISSSLLDDFYCAPSSTARPQMASLPPSTSPEGVSAPWSEYRKRAERLGALDATKGDAGTLEELNRMYRDPEAVKWFRQAAQEGDALAQWWVGRMFELGLEVPKDYQEAVEWYRKAADQGNAIAQYEMGWMYHRGRGVARDLEEALKWHRNAADKGIAKSQDYLGNMYSAGAGVPKDYEESARWYRKAADQGNAEGQWNLGGMYRNGQGIPKDEGQAKKWYRKAADQGHIRAQVDLARMYEVGRRKGYNEDVKDYKEAVEESVKWFRKAAEQGDADAQYALAVKLQLGSFIPKDEVEAVKWFGKAADQGHTAAQWSLGNCYEAGTGTAKSHEDSLKWYRKAAERGNAVRQFLLGNKFRDGQGVPKDYVEAVGWYRKAAEQRDSAAQNMLGVMYQNGWGVAKDHHEAVKWFRKAAEGGYAVAQTNLGVACKNGYGVPKDRKEAIKWLQKAADQGNEDAKKELRKMGATSSR